jgi:anti-sigma regulatory factor (Ser/Thr protein kinase)
VRDGRLMSVGAYPVGEAELHLPAERSQLALARRYVRDAAYDHGLDADAGYELEYAVNEAVTNAIRHGRPDMRGNIRLTVTSEGERLTVAVHDCGSFTGPHPCGELSSESAESGRGLALMARFVDELRVTSEPGATTVVLSKLRL